MTNLAGDLERIIYINDEKDIATTLSQIIIKLETFFKFNKNINFKDANDLEQSIGIITPHREQVSLWQN